MPGGVVTANVLPRAAAPACRFRPVEGVPGRVRAVAAAPGGVLVRALP
ncbi:MAG TPA: hypothetical protein VFS43_25610 [Polyangiaceae bacterium]|nr:hypothetical protein [Polyangiaceae bacterium]